MTANIQSICQQEGVPDYFTSSAQIAHLYSIEAVEYFPQCQLFEDNTKIKQANFNTTTINKCGRALAYTCTVTVVDTKLK